MFFIHIFVVYHFRKPPKIWAFFQTNHTSRYFWDIRFNYRGKEMGVNGFRKPWLSTSKQTDIELRKNGRKISERALSI